MTSSLCLLETSASDLTTAIADAGEAIITAEIATFEDGIEALRKVAAEATEQRTDDNAEYT